MLIDKNTDFYKKDGWGNVDEDDVSYEAPYRTSHKKMQVVSRPIDVQEARRGGPSGELKDRQEANITDKAEHYQQDLERKFERERQLSSFRRDREFIILSIQSALKSRNYAQAQELVSQYRLASEIDSEFRRLAKLTKSVCLERSAVAELLLILDATPDDDHAKLCALYERLLRLEPNNQSYIEGYRVSAQALNLEQLRGGQAQKNYAGTVFLVLFFIAIAFMFLSFFAGIL